jgi:hypothetical protein
MEIRNSTTPHRPSRRVRDAVRNPDTKICEVLAGLAAYHGRTWCYPSQPKVLELLQRFTGRRMSRRTLTRHVNGLVRDGHLVRVRRRKFDRVRGVIRASNLYHLAGRYLARLRRLVVAARAWFGGDPVAGASNGAPKMAQHVNGLLNPSLRRRL